MTGEEILKEVFKKLHNHYGLAIADFEDLVDLSSVDDIIILLVGEPLIVAHPNIVSLLNVLGTIHVGSDYLVDQFVLPNKAVLIDFMQPTFTKRHRPFSYADIEFGFLSAKKLQQIVPLDDLVSHPIDYKILLDYISTLVEETRDVEIGTILTHLEQGIDTYGILIERIVNTSSEVSTYSYLYYQKVLSGDKIPLDSRLSYTIPHGAVTAFNPATIHQQYFEIYDIINELNHADDIITRYLKLYHIIEYIIYRMELVGLEVKARTNRSFIRDIHTLTGQKTAELPLLTKNFSKLFVAELATPLFDLGSLSADQTGFLLNNWNVKTNPAGHIFFNNGSNVAQLIYMIRNSIVHNKESQFHLTTSNPEDYLLVIPIINKLIQILEKAIFDKISADAAHLSYGSPSIQLF